MRIETGMIICFENKKEQIVGEVVGISRETELAHYVLGEVDMYTSLKDLRPYYIQLGDKFMLHGGLICELKSIELEESGLFIAIMKSKQLIVRRPLKTLSKQIEKFYLA